MTCNVSLVGSIKTVGFMTIYIEEFSYQMTHAPKGFVGVEMATKKQTLTPSAKEEAGSLSQALGERVRQTTPF